MVGTVRMADSVMLYLGRKTERFIRNFKKTHSFKLDTETGRFIINNQFNN